MSFVAPLAKQAFCDALTAAGADPTNALHGVLVQRGLPVKVPADTDRIYVANVLQGTRTVEAETGIPHTSGVIRLETFVIRVLVECELVTGMDEAGSAETEAHMWAILDAIDAVVDYDDEFGGVVGGSEFMVDTEECLPMAHGWLARCLCELSCAIRV